MLIPIGHEDQTVRRLPWVTFTIIALCFVVFLGVGGAVRNAERVTADRLQGVASYWHEHPYLKLPDRFVQNAVPEGQRERLQLLGEAMAGAGRELPEEQRAEEQAELERRVDAFLAAVEAHPLRTWGLIPGKLSLLALFTSMFMHAGWLHLLGNMFILYLAGPAVEDAYGRPLYLGFYLTAGVVAAITHVVVYPHSLVPLVGASGAIAGVMGAFLVRFAHTRIRFFYWFAWIFRGTFSAPAWTMLPLWLLEQVFYASLTTSEDGVAYWAHIGGFAFGVAVAFAVKRAGVEERYIHPAIEKRITVHDVGELEEGMRELEAGRPSEARAVFERLLAADPRNPDVHLAMWEAWWREGQPARGVPHLARVIENDLSTGLIDLAWDHWTEMRGTGELGPPAMRWRLAEKLVGPRQADAMMVMETLPADRDAGILALKAARRLAALARNDLERTEWEARALRLEQAATDGGGVPAPAPVIARPAAASAGTPGAGSSASIAPQAPDMAATAEGEGSAVAGRLGTPRGASPALLRAVPKRLDAAGLVLATTEGERVVPYAAIRCIAVAGIAESGRRWLVTDLVVREDDRPEAKLRFHSTDFDPRTVLGDAEVGGIAAFRALLGAIAEASRAVILPDRGFIDGGAPTMFSSLDQFEAKIAAAAS